MPIPKTSLSEFKDHLLALGLVRDMNVAIHSNMISFGHIEGCLDGVYASIRGIIGDQATIVVPTYTSGLAPDQPFDPLRTPAQAMGVFTNYIMQGKASVRTMSPLHSHTIEGPLQHKLLAADPNQSMGSGSIFQVMQEEKFNLLLLGCSFQKGATFLHHVEACTGVPYRKWLDLERKVVRLNGSIKDVTVRYYGRKKNTGLKTDLNLIERTLQASGICTTVPIHRAASHRMDIAELFDSVQRILVSQPNIMMVSNKDE